MESKYNYQQSSAEHQWGNHPLANRPEWTSRPHLLDVLTSPRPQETADSLPFIDQKNEAIAMLREREQRVAAIFDPHPRGYKFDGWSYLNWDIIHDLAPRFVNSERRFNAINWRALTTDDKLRFWRAIDQACANLAARRGYEHVELVQKGMQLDYAYAETYRLSIEMSQMNAKLAKSIAELAHKGAELDEKNKQLVEKSKQLADKDTELDEKNKQLVEKSKQLADKDPELDEKSKQLADKDAELDEKSKQLADKDAELDEKDKQLAEALDRLALYECPPPTSGAAPPASSEPMSMRGSASTPPSTAPSFAPFTPWDPGYDWSQTHPPWTFPKFLDGDICSIRSARVRDTGGHAQSPGRHDHR